MPGLKVVFREGVAYAVGSVAGQRVRKSLGTRDKARAAELCALHEAKLWKRHSYGEESVRTFEEAAMNYMEQGKDRRYIAPLVLHFRGRRLSSIKPEEIRQAARSLGAEKRPATQNRQYIVPARAIINHGAGLGWCPKIEVSLFKVPKTPRKIVGRDWIDTFVAQADADGLPHLAAAMLFMWQTGTRVSETARVLPEQVDLSARTVKLPKTKTDEWEVRYLTTELVVRIANLPKEDGVPLFGYSSRFGIRQRMQAVCRRAKIPFVSPHQSGRHSFFSEALGQGMPLPAVMKAGGAKTARLVLETYAHAQREGLEVADMFDEVQNARTGTDQTQPPGKLAQVVGRKRKT